MQNREVPVGNLPIFFSSRQRAEAGRSRPEVWVGETGRGTRATVRGTQKTEPRAGRRVRGAGRGCGTRKTRAWGAGRKTRNTWTRTRARGTGARARGHGHGGTGCRTQDAERRTQNTGYWPRAAEHGKRGHEVQKTGHRRRGTSPRAWTAARLHTPARPRNNLPGPFTAGRHPPPGPIRRDLSRLDARRRDPQQPAGAIHSRAPSATGTCNNPPGPFTAGRHPPRAAPYLSRVRIRITPLPPRTPYMLLPRCTSTDLTS